MTSINPKDLEAISAYIDQALDKRERARLEERLKNEPELRAELNSMRRTQQILRSAPVLRAPRNFTLTPEMVGAASRKQNRFLPVTRFAFVLASIFFVFAIVGNFTFGSIGAPQSDQSIAMSAPAEPMAMEAAEADTAADTMEEPVPEVMEMEAASAVEEAAPAGDVVTEESVADATGLDGTPGPIEESVEALAPTEEALSVAAEPPAEEGDAARTMESENAAAESAAAGETSVQKADPDEVDTDTGAGIWSAWLIAAAVSGGLAVVSGALTLALRRK